jgi:opacity protein-like surface antigen
MLLSSPMPAAAQFAPGGSEVRGQRYNAPRKKQRVPKDTSPDWRGFSVDFGVYRPIISHVTITDDTKRLGQFNLTGIHLGGAAAYLFQDGRFVLGPRIKATGGWVETMPSGYTIHTHAIFTLGGELGFAVGSLYGYAFGGGGGAWTSAEKIGVERRDNTVSAFELGAGLRYALPGNWYAKTEMAYVTLGDHRLGADYFENKAFLMWGGGFGFRFAPN